MDSPELQSNETNAELPENILEQIPDTIRELVSRITENLTEYLADPDSEDACNDGLAELASGERVDGDAFISGHVDA